MSAPVVRWALSPRDFHAHAVTGPADATADGSSGVMVARCGHAMPTAAGVDSAPRAALCAACVRVSGPADLGGWGGPP